MGVWVCRQDGVRYSVGAPHCPQCGTDDPYEEGDESMAKISKAAGATDKRLSTAFDDRGRPVDQDDLDTAELAQENKVGAVDLEGNPLSVTDVERTDEDEKIETGEATDEDEPTDPDKDPDDSDDPDKGNNGSSRGARTKNNAADTEVKVTTTGETSRTSTTTTPGKNKKN